MKKIFVNIKIILNLLLVSLIFIIWGFFVPFLAIIQPKSKKILFKWSGFWNRVFLFINRIKIEAHGLENLTPEKPQIYSANHASHMDAITLTATLPVYAGWIAKKELLWWPIFGWNLRLINSIPIDRGNREKAMLSMKKAADRIKSGNSIYIFPEGTRTKTGELSPLKKGAFHLSLDSGVPIIPIFIRGTREVMAAGSLDIHPGKVYIEIGEPLNPANYNHQKIDKMQSDLLASWNTLRNKIESRIK